MSSSSSSSTTSSSADSNSINDELNDANEFNDNNELRCDATGEPAKTSPWGDGPFQPKEIPGLPGYYVYTRADFNYWMEVHHHLTCIHKSRIFKYYKLVSREQDQINVLYALQGDTQEELVRRAVSENLHMMLQFYDPREPIAVWPMRGDRYNQ
ncbi:hypothetical protein O0I10_012458 [Lichtheimia ornata]|uniref:Uncharacterized protein n=1 Tax=Lichtheimia ornata TaxID=688661 RepID=A0AAD7XT28_9FUNG|nr:uncharacterized protein O0I10_012458 [Lichtheimia ornata]KAJ8651968.1 hypothetical protein O0I10_012458 [Lichtheimia ornata]